MRRKIAINAFHLTGNRAESGIGRYIANIIKYLGDCQPCNHYYLFSPSRDAAFPSASIRHVFLPMKKEPYTQTIATSRQFRKIRPDLLFSPHVEFPRFRPEHFPMVCVVHDIIPTQSLLPAFYLKKKYPFKLLTTRGIYDFFMLRKWLKSIKRVITVSRSSKEAILAVFGEKYRHKISVIANGVDPVFIRASRAKSHARLARMNPRYKRYLIYFGGHAVRKNLVRSVRAYQMLPEPLRSRYPFVIVGEGYQKDMILKHRLNRNVICVPRVSDLALSELVSGAALSIYPSLMEGFGLPIIESLAAGVMPLVSDIPSSREILGPDYPMFDPMDENEICRRLKTFLECPEKRHKWVSESQNIWKQYSWEQSALQTVKVLNLSLSPDV